MLARDLSIGGFAGATGTLSVSVQRKKRMLEAEGVVFDAKGRAAKDAMYSFGHVGEGDQIGAKRQRTSENLNRANPPSVSVGTLRESILKMLTKRGPGKSC